MKVTELRDELRNRGLDTSGLKAELVSRLEEDDQNKGGASSSSSTAKAGSSTPAAAAAKTTAKRTISQAIADLKEEGKKKVKVSRKVDANFPYGGEVVEDYDCMLNQTNIGQNNNKFYVIQVIQTGKGEFYCYTRWGTPLSFSLSRLSLSRLSLFLFLSLSIFLSL